MAILHGSWIPEGKVFFIWGEIWRRIDAKEFPQLHQTWPHPFGMTPAELVSFITSQTQQTGKDQVSTNESGQILPPVALQLPNTQSTSDAGGRKRKIVRPMGVNSRVRRCPLYGLKQKRLHHDGDRRSSLYRPKCGKTN